MASLVLVDFKKAFDYVRHDVAITELLRMGCRASIVPFIVSFLTDRQHRVRHQDATSSYAPITCGVPQGIVAGPVIFISLVNGLCKLVEKRVKFVDDLTLAYITKFLTEINFPIQVDLDRLSGECQDRGMEPNPLKCEVLHTIPTRRRRPAEVPELTLDGITILVVDTVKLLGVHLNDRLDWKTHVKNMLTKANKCIFVIHRAKKFNFSIKTILTLFQWYIRTPLEYAAPVWHPGLTKEQHHQLERIQKRCFRVILGQQYTTYAEALAQLNQQSLFDRRQMLTLRLGRSMLRSQRHRDLLPPTGRQVHGRITRHGGNLRPPARRSARYEKTFVPYVVKLLNQN